MSNLINSNQLHEKFNLLNSLQKETIYYFIEYLLSKKSIELMEKKNILLKTSVWSEEDIKYIEDAQKEMNKWKI
jgi:hypothetical protein